MKSGEKLNFKQCLRECVRWRDVVFLFHGSCYSMAPAMKISMLIRVGGGNKVSEKRGTGLSCWLVLRYQSKDGEIAGKMRYLAEHCAVILIPLPSAGWTETCIPISHLTLPSLHLPPSQNTLRSSVAFIISWFAATWSHPAEGRTGLIKTLAPLTVSPSWCSNLFWWCEQQHLFWDKPHSGLVGAWSLYQSSLYELRKEKNT